MNLNLRAMRIDAHQHFWKYQPLRDSWIEEGMEILMRDFLPADLDPELRLVQIDGCVAVQSDSSENDNHFLLDLASKNPMIKGIVGWVDLCSPALGDRLEYWSQQPLIKGFRHVLEAEDIGFMVKPDFNAGLNLLSQTKFTYDLLVSSQQLEAAATLAAKHPRLSIVLDHLGKPDIHAWKTGKEPGFLSWERSIKHLAALPNVSCKLSGMVTEAHLMSWKPGDMRPFFDVVLSSFGAGRLMFGSDWPVCLRAASYPKVSELAKSLLSECSLSEREGIFGFNAAKFYSI